MTALPFRCLVTVSTSTPPSPAVDALTDAFQEVVRESSAKSAMERVLTWRPHVVVVHDGFADAETANFVRRVRGISPALMLVISESSTLPHRVALIEAGADDVQPADIAVEELLARVRRALSRRHAPASFEDWISAGVLYMDTRGREVTCGRRRVNLTPKEYGLLCVLMALEGQVVTRSTILDSVWGEGFLPESNVVDRQIRSLRRKLAPEAGHYIETVPRLGYRLRTDAVDSLRWDTSA